MRSTRRRMLAAIAALPTLAAAPALAAGADERRLQNRLELWTNYARRTRNLVARVTTTRETSLLDEPLVATGTLIFRAPATLVLRDDGLLGSTTRIDDGRLEIIPNGPELPAGPRIDPQARPGAAWLADRLIRLFAPGDGAAMIEDARAKVPRGRGHRLELMPPRGSVVRQEIRSLTVHLDPVAGAVTEMLIAEAQGDRVHMGLADHRQNLPDEDVDALLEQVDDLARQRRESE